MYDPELSWKDEQDLLDDEMTLSQVEHRLGVNHPWTQRIRLTRDIFRDISQKENDLSNTFDSEVRSGIERRIDELLAIARQLLDKM